MNDRASRIEGEDVKLFVNGVEVGKLDAVMYEDDGSVFYRSTMSQEDRPNKRTAVVGDLPARVGEGDNRHNTGMSLDQFVRTSLVYCADCGMVVKDNQGYKLNIPCNPIRVGDRFRYGVITRTIVGRDPDRPGAWLACGELGSAVSFIPAELKCDWERLPREVEPALAGGSNEVGQVRTDIHQVDNGVSSGRFVKMVSERFERSVKGLVDNPCLPRAVEKAVSRGLEGTGQGHRVDAGPGGLYAASKAWCVDCGQIVKDRSGPSYSGPCDPIRVGDKFQDIYDHFVVTVVRRYSNGKDWVVAESSGRERIFAASTLSCGKVRLPRSQDSSHLGHMSWSSDRSHVQGSVPSHYKDRSEVERCLALDARANPEFSAARRAAVLAYVEAVDACPEECRRDVLLYRSVSSRVSGVLTCCLRYEQERGGSRTPSRRAVSLLDSWGTDEFLRRALTVYEAARGR